MAAGPRDPKPRATDDRLVDVDVESLIEEEDELDVPDDERVVPEDVNEYVPEPDTAEDQPPV
jgi:hypothetical protein